MIIQCIAVISWYVLFWFVLRKTINNLPGLYGLTNFMRKQGNPLRNPENSLYLSYESKKNQTLEHKVHVIIQGIEWRKMHNSCLFSHAPKYLMCGALEYIVLKKPLHSMSMHWHVFSPLYSLNQLYIWLHQNS